MPVGIIINCLSIVTGGLAGTLIGHKLPAKGKTQLHNVLGFCSIGMGVSSISLMQNMPAVIFAVVIGTSFGLAIKLGVWINKGASQMERPIGKLFANHRPDMPMDDYLYHLVTIIVLFCASGTGIYGCLDAGMTGDNSILISKSILDLFTAAVFACNLGAVVSFIALPQFVIFLLLFFCAQIILPLTTPYMIDDFRACGGFLIMAAGFRMLRVKDLPIADMLPAMVLVMPFSWLWQTQIMPLIS